jgi:hypothetical protein
MVEALHALAADRERLAVLGLRARKFAVEHLEASVWRQTYRHTILGEPAASR